MEKRIKANLEESAALKLTIAKNLHKEIEQVANKIIGTLKNGHKVMICGNGGSAADAQHMAAELAGRYLMDRKPLAAMALSTDTSIITAVGNDFGFENIFSKQVEGLGNSGDILIGISTSGNSKNIEKAFLSAKNKKIATIGLLGNDGGSLGKIADINIIIPSNITPRIQEGHITIIHTLCGLIEEEIFKK